MNLVAKALLRVLKKVQLSLSLIASSFFPLSEQSDYLSASDQSDYLSVCLSERLDYLCTARPTDQIVCLSDRTNTKD